MHPLILEFHFLNMISAERAAATEGKPARIIAKLNALTDPELIKALLRCIYGWSKNRFNRPRHVLPASSGIRYQRQYTSHFSDWAIS